jgi:CSLREA domain-containing protein
MKSYPLFFRSVIGIALVLAATLVLCAGARTKAQAPAIGTLFLVNSTGDDPEATPDNQCETAIGNGVCTLRAAIQLVNSRNNGGDGIAIGVTGTITLNSTLPNLSVPVHISGPGANSLTVARNASIFRIFNVTTTGTVSLSGLTISNGIANGDGGGIQNASTGTVNVTNCVITGNQATDGGAVSNATTGRITLTGCSIVSNQSSLQNGHSFGGAVYNPNGSVTITNSLIFNNAAVGGQGFTGFGGGAYNAGTLTVINSTMLENVARSNDTGFETGIGGGIYNLFTAIVSNSTITGNLSAGGQANADAGGIQNAGSGVTQIKSSIVAGNNGSGPDVGGSFSSAGFNLIGATDGSTGFTVGTDQTGTAASLLDPEFDALHDNGGPTQTLGLRCGSPAIDKGSSAGLTGALTTDQRGTGFARTVDDPLVPNAAGGDGTDIGAFEYGAGPIVPSSVVSRKFHGTGNPSPHFDITLPLSCSSLGIECRRNTGADTTGPNVGHDHELIVTFGSNVTVSSVDVVDDSTGFSAGTATFSTTSNKVTVDLHNIPNPVRLGVNLRGVSDGTNTGLVSIPMGVLLGDVNGSGRVDAADVSAVRQQTLQPITSSNFREDVNVSGRIDAADVSIARQQTLTSLP